MALTGFVGIVGIYRSLWQKALVFLYRVQGAAKTAWGARFWGRVSVPVFDTHLSAGLRSLAVSARGDLEVVVVSHPPAPVELERRERNSVGAQCRL